MIINYNYVTDHEAHDNIWLGYVLFTPRDLIKCTYKSTSDEPNKISFDKKELFNKNANLSNPFIILIIVNKKRRVSRSSL